MKTIKITVINTTEPQEEIIKEFTGNNIPEELDKVVVEFVGGRPNDRR
jgi:hypothetical protein